MRTQSRFNPLFLLLVFGAPTGAMAQVDPQLAQRYFDEVRKLCERDAGRLWGVSLCGPLVIFDPATGTRATSEPEPPGPIPRFPGFADGPVTWGGRVWFAAPMYMLPALFVVVPVTVLQPAFGVSQHHGSESSRTRRLGVPPAIRRR